MEQSGHTQVLSPSDVSRSGEELWQVATKVVKAGVGTSLAFKTLRNRAADAYIPESSLKKIRRLGQGAFAVVDECLYETGQGRAGPVAVKRLKPEIFSNEEDVKMFLEEAALLKKLRHSCIVDFLGVGYTSQAAASIVEKGDVTDEAAESLYLVQEFMGQGNLKLLILKQMLTHRRRLYTNMDSMEWSIQLAKGLRYLHTSKPTVIHRDMKLENVLLKRREDGKLIVKLADFGLSTVVESHGKSIKIIDDSNEVSPSGHLAAVSSKGANLTAAQACYDLSGRTGSLMYMAPEVLRCQHYNEKCDIFALGVIIYEIFMRTVLLTFVSCVGDPSEVENYARSVAQGARPSFPEDFPAGIRDLIKKCWDGDMKLRPSAHEVVQALELLMSDPDCTMDTAMSSGCTCCSIQ